MTQHDTYLTWYSVDVEIYTREESCLAPLFFVILLQVNVGGDKNLIKVGERMDKLIELKIKYLKALRPRKEYLEESGDVASKSGIENAEDIFIRVWEEVWKGDEDEY